MPFIQIQIVYWIYKRSMEKKTFNSYSDLLPTLFNQYSQSSKKVFFHYNLQTRQFDYLSPAIELIWELNHEQILQAPEELLTRIGKQDREAVALRLEKGSQGLATEMEFSLQFPDNRSKQVKVDAHPLLNASGTCTHIMGQAEDVTEQAQYREYLLEFARKKNNVLLIVAHDLQGPLSIMKGVAALLDQDHAESHYEDLATYTNIIGTAYTDCTRLIKEVLLDEHTKSISTPVEKVRFDALEKVRQTADTFVRSKIVKAAIHIHGPEEGIMVELDEMKFTQIINNLLTNSIKFTPPVGIITITLRIQGSDLLLTHADTGIGIPEELQPYLFEKYNNKAARRGLNGEESNGLGLSIIKDLVEIQGGKIQVESKENLGTTFSVSFPLHL